MIFRRQGSVKDDDHPGHWSTSITANIIEKVQDTIKKDHRLGVWAIAEMVNLDRKSVWCILTDELNMKTVCVKMVPKIPLAEQRVTGNLFWPLAMHSEWTGFLEISNYLWWDSDIYMIQKQNDYWCTRSYQTLQGQKRVPWVVRSSRPCWLFSLISWVLWWQSGYPVARLSISTVILKSWLNWMIEKKMARIVEKRVDFASGKCAIP